MVRIAPTDMEASRKRLRGRRETPREAHNLFDHDREVGRLVITDGRRRPLQLSFSQLGAPSRTVPQSLREWNEALSKASLGQGSMTAMPPVQLILRELGDGSEQLEAVDNPQSKGPAELESVDGSVHVPRLGTEAFVRLVAALSALGFGVERFEFRDARMHPLEGEDADEISARLRENLRDGNLQGALRFLNSEADDVYIVAITVSEPNRRRFRLAQSGAITGFNSSPDRLIAALRQAWTKAGVA